MNLKALGWARTLRGLREGNQTILLTGLGLIALQMLRNSKEKRQLVYRKALPVGSAIVIRHAKPGTPRLRLVEKTD
ncbi:MAG TPA: hypothetical protein VF377_01090 [Acidimicrobiia bacterium]|jgi:hypothetical protein